MVAKASEIRLFERIVNGEEQALEHLYQLTCKSLYVYLNRLLGDKELLLAAFVKTYRDAWNNAEEFDEKFSAVNWLIKRARAIAYSMWEAKAFSQSSATTDNKQPERIVALDRQKTFIKAMHAMPIEDREALGMVLMPLYTYHQLAELLGESIDALKQRVFAAKSTLKEQLKQHGIKKHEVSKSNILRELIPLYINGALSGKHREAFEKSLKNDNNLKQEYMEFYEIETFFDQTEEITQQYLDSLYPKVKKALGEKDEEDEEGEAYEEEVEESFLHQLLSSSQLGWGLAVLQFAILAFVLLFMDSDNTNKVHATSAAQLIQAASRGKQVNIVFKDSATQKEIRDLLLQHKAQMYSGPSDIGLYTVTVEGSDERVHKIITDLRQSSLILLADPAF